MSDKLVAATGYNAGNAVIAGNAENGREDRHPKNRSVECGPWRLRFTIR